jgi:translation elongation factor EF-Tu-like GTPase
MMGGVANQERWEAKVKELEVKLAKAEAESQKENVKIVEKIVTKTQIVKERGADIIRYVDREVIKYDTKFAPGGVCEIPKEFIKAHNDAAEKTK